MNRNLLIIGAGIYGLVAKEIAESMNCFEKIDFVDDLAEKTPDGISVKGKTSDIKVLNKDYGCIVVAIGNPEFRLKILKSIEEETDYNIVNLISPYSYVSASAKLGKGCIVEPMAVVHTGCIMGDGCLISAGAVVNHAAVLCEGVHIDCNATVTGYKTVPRGTKVESGAVFK